MINDDKGGGSSSSKRIEEKHLEEVAEVVQRMMESSYSPSPGKASTRVSGATLLGPSSGSPSPYVKIVEQPARCALRFRYECEGRSAGSIPGQSATAENKTYPTIQVIDYKGPAVVVVSCVTKDLPYRPHPHNLVGKEGCKKGVCTMVINNLEMVCSFTSLGIQCVKRKDIEDSLKLRETIKVDPFRTGFSHKSQASNIDLNVVRLCFQVFIEGPEKDKFTVPLSPIVSEAIYDKKAMSELVITKLSHCSASVSGGKEIILLCDRVTKDDVQVRFYEERNGQLVWEGFGDFQPNDVHKQVAICFRSPRYFNESVQQPVLVHLQLRRPSDGQFSDSRPFQLLPREVDPEGLTRKRQKLEKGSLDHYLRDNLLLSNALSKSPSPAPSPASADPVAAAEEATLGVRPIGASALPNTAINEIIRVPRLSAKIKIEAPIEMDSAEVQPTAVSSWITSASPSTALRSSLSSPSQAHSISILPQQQQQQTSPSHTFNQPLNQSFFQPQTSINVAAAQQFQGNLINVKKELIADAFKQLAASTTTTMNQSFTNSMASGSQTAVSSMSNMANNNNVVEGALSDRLDSLDLDIDPNDLMNDINFNNLMVMMDSGNNITFNSSGNITDNTGLGVAAASGSLQTPQIIEINDSTKNLLSSAAQMSRLNNELIQLQNQISSGKDQEQK